MRLSLLPVVLFLATACTAPPYQPAPNYCEQRCGTAEERVSLQTKCRGYARRDSCEQAVTAALQACVLERCG